MLFISQWRFYSVIVYGIRFKQAFSIHLDYGSSFTQTFIRIPNRRAHFWSNFQTETEEAWNLWQNTTLRQLILRTSRSGFKGKIYIKFFCGGRWWKKKAKTTFFAFANLSEIPFEPLKVFLSPYVFNYINGMVYFVIYIFHFHFINTSFMLYVLYTYTYIFL